MMNIFKVFWDPSASRQNKDTINCHMNSIPITITETTFIPYLPLKHMKLICMCFFLFG